MLNRVISTEVGIEQKSSKLLTVISSMASKFLELFASPYFLISIEQFKKALGPTAELLTADQIERLRDVHYGLANALFDSWLKKERGNQADNGKIER